jgi:hypothetical protein
MNSSIYREERESRDREKIVIDKRRSRGGDNNHSNSKAIKHGNRIVKEKSDAECWTTEPLLAAVVSAITQKDAADESDDSSSSDTVPVPTRENWCQTDTKHLATVTTSHNKKRKRSKMCEVSLQTASVHGLEEEQQQSQTQQLSQKPSPQQSMIPLSNFGHRVESFGLGSNSSNTTIRRLYGNNDNLAVLVPMHDLSGLNGGVGNLMRKSFNSNLSNMMTTNGNGVGEHLINGNV